MSYMTFKIVVVGEPQVGKTTLVQTIQSEKAPETGYKATIGVNYVMATSTVGKGRVTLQLWDIAGQERLIKHLRAYYEHAYLALVVVSSENIDQVLAGASSVEKQVEFFRSTDYVIPNSCRPLPTVLVISKWDLTKTTDNRDKLKKELESYGKRNGFEFTAFTSVHDPDLKSVLELKDRLIDSCLKISNSQMLRVQFLGSNEAIARLVSVLDAKPGMAGADDSKGGENHLLPLGPVLEEGKEVTLDIRPGTIPIKAPLYSEAHIVGTALVLSAEDFEDKVTGVGNVQKLINYLNDTRGMKIYGYDNYMKICVIYLDGCFQKISAKDTATLSGTKEMDIKSFTGPTGRTELKTFLSKMAEEWNSIFVEDKYDDGDYGVDLDEVPEEKCEENPKKSSCMCGHH